MSLTFPEAKNVTQLLDALLGDCPPLQESEDGPPLASLTPLHGSTCLDNEGREVAILLADLTAAVALGGKLMLLPVGQLEEQMETQQVSEIVVDALSEVFNNLTTTLNSFEENEHVRSLPAEAVDITGEGCWWSDAGARVDYVGDFDRGVGRLVVLAR